MQQIKDMGSELAKLDSVAAKGDYNAKETKVVHLKKNPVQKARHLKMLDEVRQQLLSENSSATGASAEQVADLKKQLAALQKRHALVMESFNKTASDFRDACFHLLGWDISLTTDSKGNQNYKLRSMYAQAETEYFVFKRPKGADSGRLDLEPTEYALTLQKEIEVLLQQFKSIPAFLSHVTTEVWNAKTAYTQYM